MKLLIVAATEFEIAPFIFKKMEADILITGVGSPACIYALTKRLQQSKYDFVIQPVTLGDLVLDLAGDAARLAADALAGVDHHRVLVAHCGLGR